MLILTVWLIACNSDPEIPPAENLVVNLGNDTTLYVGDTLILDAGPGFDSYLWNDSLATEQTLPVTETGEYWVVVTKNDQIAMDTISVSFVCDSTYTVAFFEWSLTIPCSYTNGAGGGIDSYSIHIRSESQDVVIEYERGPGTFQDYDTLYQLPDTYGNLNETIDIFNNDNQEIGRVYFRTTSYAFRNILGGFFIKEDSYYLGIMRLEYASDKADEVIEILSTIE